MVFARERSSEMPCTPNEGGTLMNRVRVSIVALLGVLGSPMAWSASAAPPSHTGAATTSAPDGAPGNINSAVVKELMKLEGVNLRVAEKIVEFPDTHGPVKAPAAPRKVEGA